MKTIPCPKCRGKGEHLNDPMYPPRRREHMYLIACRHCGGTGKLPAPKKGKTP